VRTICHCPYYPSFIILLRTHTHTQGLSRKFCNTLYTSVKINTQCLQFFLWWILNVPLAMAAPQNNTFPRACAVSSNDVVWWCAFEQETITILGRTVLPHSPHITDLAHSDFHLFGALKRSQSWEKVWECLGVMTTLLQKWGNGCE
jgi:hypothetical protein